MYNFKEEKYFEKRKERQKDKTERQKDRTTERQNDRTTERQKDRKTERQKYFEKGPSVIEDTVTMFVRSYLIAIVRGY